VCLSYAFHATGRHGTGRHGTEVLQRNKNISNADNFLHKETGKSRPEAAF